MASIINAATSGGLVTSADTSGVLQLQTASTTAVTVDASQNVSLAVGTANGVTYLNGSKVLTSGSALTFDGTNLTAPRTQFATSGSPPASGAGLEILGGTSPLLFAYNRGTSAYLPLNATASAFGWALSGSDAMTLTSTGLGIGTSSPASKFQVTSANGAVTLDSGTGESHYIDITHKGSYSDLGGIRFNQGSTTYGNNQILFRAMDSGGTVQTVMTLNGAGNLGLGVTPSAWSQGKALEISAVGEGLWGNGLGDIWMMNGAYFNAGWKYSGTTKATAYRQGGGVSDGSHSWYTAASGTAGNAISFTQALTLNTNGALVLQGGNTSASGVGVAFPATQSASSDANTLDDYEEGTWTPTDGSGAGLSLTATFATYTKVGRLVTCSAKIVYPSTANTAQSQINGLPFTSSSNNHAISTMLTDSGTYFSNLVPESAAYLYPYNLTTTRLTNANLTGKLLIFTVSYIV